MAHYTCNETNFITLALDTGKERGDLARELGATVEQIEQWLNSDNSNIPIYVKSYAKLLFKINKDKELISAFDTLIDLFKDRKAKQWI